MTNFDKIKAMNADELAEWLCDHFPSDDSPWEEMFSKTFCDNCPTSMGRYADGGPMMEFSWCEMHEGQCKFFPDIQGIPCGKKVVSIWLEREADENEEEKRD